jgi:hypothetical protein
MAKLESTRLQGERESRADVDDVRRELFGASGILTIARYALASKLEGLDNESVIDALQVAIVVVDNAAEALERHT